MAAAISYVLVLLLQQIYGVVQQKNIYIYIYKLRGLSPQENYTDRATAAVGEVVPTFAGRGCYVVSVTDSHGR
jgi:hypothetical protein